MAEKIKIPEWKPDFGDAEYIRLPAFVAIWRPNAPRCL
jgi:glutamate formiminotransferase